jgi:hypothetical protein
VNTGNCKCDLAYPEQNVKLTFEQRQELTAILEQTANEDYITGVLSTFISQRDDMLEALETVSALLQEGFLVRDTRGDDQSDWAIKAFPKLRKLALVTEAIRKVKGEL